MICFCARETEHKGQAVGVQNFRAPLEVRFKDIFPYAFVLPWHLYVHAFTLASDSQRRAFCTGRMQLVPMEASVGEPKEHEVCDGHNDLRIHSSPSVLIYKCMQLSRVISIDDAF